MGVIIGIAVAAFGVFWTIMAISGGAGFMAPFGIIFVIIAIVTAVYNYRNATSKNRYSEYDITDEDEEPDPLNERIKGQAAPKPHNGRFCPYCGTQNEEDYKYCTSCGRELP